MLFNKLMQLFLFYYFVDFQIYVYFWKEMLQSCFPNAYRITMIFNQLCVEMQYAMCLFIYFDVVCFVSAFPRQICSEIGMVHRDFGHDYCKTEIHKVAFYWVIVSCSQSSQDYFLMHFSYHKFDYCTTVIYSTKINIISSKFSAVSHNSLNCCLTFQVL